MFRHAFTLILMGWAFIAHAQGQSVELKARIEKIENGLLEPVAVRGAPTRKMRLIDRMQALHVPGGEYRRDQRRHGGMGWFLRCCGREDGTSHHIKHVLSSSLN